MIRAHTTRMHIVGHRGTWPRLPCPMQPCHVPPITHSDEDKATLVIEENNTAPPFVASLKVLVWWLTACFDWYCSIEQPSVMVERVNLRQCQIFDNMPTMVKSLSTFPTNGACPGGRDCRHCMPVGLLLITRTHMHMWDSCQGSRRVDHPLASMLQKYVG